MKWVICDRCVMYEPMIADCDNAMLEPPAVTPPPPTGVDEGDLDGNSVGDQEGD